MAVENLTWQVNKLKRRVFNGVGSGRASKREVTETREKTVLLTLMEQLKFHEPVLKRQLGQLHEQNRNQDSFNTNTSWSSWENTQQVLSFALSRNCTCDTVNFAPAFLPSSPPLEDAGGCNQPESSENKSSAGSCSSGSISNSDKTCSI